MRKLSLAVFVAAYFDERRRGRFECYVERGPGCWAWRGPVMRRNYGVFRGGDRPKFSFLAHRLSYWIYRGPFDEALGILHSCDNPNCVNPDHLRPGTQHDNMQDMLLRKGHFAANKTDCKRGHPLSGPNLFLHPDGRRECLTCKRERKVIWRNMRREKGLKAT